MGNILTNANGDQTAINNTTTTINDLLLELNLFNKKSNNTPRLRDSTKPYDASNNPYISELDFRQSALNSLNIENPKNANRQRVDFNGIKYTSNDDDMINANTNDAMTWSDAGINDSNYWLYQDKMYNIKRGFCNATGTVPVTILGVDLPQVGVSNDQNQLSYEQVNNCTKFGTLTGNNGGQYMIDLTPVYFTSNNLKYIDFHTDISSLRVSETAAVVVDRLSPFYLPPLNDTPIAIGSNSSLIQIGYIPDNILNRYLTADSCIGFYAELNPNYNATSSNNDNRSQVILFPLLLTTGMNTIAEKCTTSNKVDFTLGTLLSSGPTGFTCSSATYPTSGIVAPTSLPVMATSTANNGTTSISQVPKDTPKNKYLIKPGMTPANATINVLTLPNLGTSIVTRTSAPSSTINLNYAIFLKTKIPLTPIIPNDILNDMRSSTLNDLANQSVYGMPMTDDCKYGLANLMTNSYINAKIGNYSKLGSMLHPTIPLATAQNDLNTNTDTKKYQLNTDKNGNNLITLLGNNVGDSTNQRYGAINNSDTQNNTNLVDVLPSCGSFYKNMCEYHYYYDKKDGLIYNKSFSDRIANDQNIGSYKNNLQYLNEHIPDCRCNTYSTDTGGDVTKYYATTGCMSQDSNKTNTGGNRYGKNDVKQIPLYNYNLDDGKNKNAFKDKGFRNQYDPVRATAGLMGGQFLYAGAARGRAVTFNSYTCNISNTINVGAGGNVAIGNVNLDCNFESSTDSKTPENPGGAMLTMSVSFKDAVTNSRYSLNNPNFKVPLNYDIPLIVDITWLNPAYQNTFLKPSNYVFAFYLGSDTKQYINAKFDCTTSEESTMGAGDATPTKSCIGPYTVYTPFIIGKTNSNSEKYILSLISGKTNTITSRQVTVYMKQYSMKITNIVLAGFTSKVTTNYNTQPSSPLSVTINVITNTTDILSNLSYRIKLTPLIETNSDGTPNPPIIIYGTNFYSDFAINNTSGVGSYKVEDSLKPIVYTIAVSLGIQKDYTNTTYYVDNPPTIKDMYFSDCTIDTDFFLVDDSCRLGLIDLSGLGLDAYRPVSLAISPEDVSIAIKEQQKLTSKVLPAIAFNKKVKWVSDDPEIVAVSDTGVITGLVKGTTTITGTTIAKNAKKEYLKQTINVNVTQTSSSDFDVNTILNNPVYLIIAVILGLFVLRIIFGRR